MLSQGGVERRGEFREVQCVAVVLDNGIEPFEAFHLSTHTHVR